MADKQSELQQILQLDDLKKLFGHFFVTTGLNVGLYDEEGRLVLFCGEEGNVCALNENCKSCRELLVYGGEKSKQLGEPYIYRCGCGLIMCSSPVVSGERLIGSIACGPVMLWEADDFARREVDSLLNGMPAGKLTDRAFAAIKRLDCVNMTSASQILFFIVNQLIKTQADFLTQRAQITVQQARIGELIARSKATAASVDALEKNVTLRKYPVETEKELISFVQAGDKERARSILNNLLGEIFSLSGGEMDVMCVRLYELVAFLSRAAVDAGAPLKEVSGIIKKTNRILSDDVDYETVCFVTSEAMEGLLDTVYRNRAVKPPKELLSKALRYIELNYEEDLSLAGVARNIYVSSYYLSHLFREEMNTTFIEYVTKVRIEKAKDLLKQKDVKIQEVSEMVGFNDANYFAKAFKRYTGTSPKEYQRLFK